MTRMLTPRGLSAVLAVAAGACVFGFLGRLSAACGSTGDDLALVLLIGAGFLLAGALVLLGSRRSRWLWIGALAGGAALSAALFVISLVSWAETCTR